MIPPTLRRFCWVVLALFVLPGWTLADVARPPFQTQRPLPLDLPPAPQGSMHPAVARIVAPGKGSVSYGSGSLVFADDTQGIVITNWHVINEANGPVSVHFPDGFYSLGTVRAADRDWDLAAIVIRKPPELEPIRLADAAPRPGEVLTIAGYGSGQYRAASGPCTQYVAPGTRFPFEMVEVAVSARQGDSGGPILNNRGELAGVLFGEGNGRTSGSYCGRVRWFLSSVVPAGGSLPPNLDRTPAALAAVPPREKPIVESLASTPRISNAPASQWSKTGSQPRVGSRQTTAPSMIPDRAEPAALEARTIGWNDVAGDTFGEQAKTVLAIIGSLAILLHALSWLGREPAKR